MRRRHGSWMGCTLLAVSLFVAACSAQHGSAPPAGRSRGKAALDALAGSATQMDASAKLLGTIRDDRIRESSGLARSAFHANVLWTHNDSGDGPCLYALDRTGKTLSRCTLPDAANVDWEDMANGPGANGKPALYVADFGDNSHNRSSVVLYRIPEPDVDPAKPLPERKTVRPEIFPFRYPDGAHDAETLLVHPKSGEVVVVTKEGSGLSGVYAFPRPLTTGQTTTLQKTGTITFVSQFLGGLSKRLASGERMATGGAVSPDGRHIFIRTYLMGYEWTVQPDQTLVRALQGKPRPRLLPLMKQGEAVCYRADGKAITLTSEGEHSPIYEVSLR